MFTRSGLQVPETVGGAVKWLVTSVRERTLGWVEFSALKATVEERRTWLKERTAERDEAQTARDELWTALRALDDEWDETRMERRGRVDAVTAQIREMDAARQTTMVMMARIHGEMADKDRRILSWYRYRGIFQAWSRFAAWCTTRWMI